jgi:hypothetical protein
MTDCDGCHTTILEWSSHHLERTKKRSFLKPPFAPCGVSRSPVGDRVIIGVKAHSGLVCGCEGKRWEWLEERSKRSEQVFAERVFEPKKRLRYSRLHWRGDSGV